MIKADVLITNKNWKKHIKYPSVYINKKLKKIDKKMNVFKKNSWLRISYPVPARPPRRKRARTAKNDLHNHAFGSISCANGSGALQVESPRFFQWLYCLDPRCKKLLDPVKTGGASSVLDNMDDPPPNLDGVRG